jgi:hypothetical protein
MDVLLQDKNDSSVIPNTPLELNGLSLEPLPSYEEVTRGDTRVEQKQR